MSGLHSRFSEVFAIYLFLLQVISSFNHSFIGGVVVVARCVPAVVVGISENSQWTGFPSVNMQEMEWGQKRLWRQALHFR